MLDWLGRQFQQDLVLMGHRKSRGRGGEGQQGEELVCLGGHLCFGSGWSLADKMGKPILDIHAQVPGFAEAAGTATDRLLRRLKAGRPIGRWNWTLSAIDRLNLAPFLAHVWMSSREQITPQNAGERCFVRAERQTLSRLPRPRGILFTIHTYLTSVEDVAADSTACRRLLRCLPGETRAYREMANCVDALIAYLTAAA